MSRVMLCKDADARREAQRVATPTRCASQHRRRAVSISGALCPDAACRRSAQGGMVWPASRLTGENGEQRFGFHGVPEQPPLPKEAAVPAQELQLLARLHALGDD